MEDLLPTELVELDPEAAEVALVETFAAFIAAFQTAQACGLDAQAIIAAHLREAMGDAWNDLPPMARMLLG